MTHNEFAGYAQFSIMQKTTSNGLCAERNLNHTSAEGSQDRLYFEMKYYKNDKNQSGYKRLPLFDIGIKCKRELCKMLQCYRNSECVLWEKLTWGLSAAHEVRLGKWTKNITSSLQFDAFIQKHNLHVQHNRLILSDRKHVIRSTMVVLIGRWISYIVLASVHVLTCVHYIENKYHPIGLHPAAVLKPQVGYYGRHHLVFLRARSEDIWERVWSWGENWLDLAKNTRSCHGSELSITKSSPKGYSALLSVLLYMGPSFTNRKSCCDEGDLKLTI